MEWSGAEIVNTANHIFVVLSVKGCILAFIRQNLVQLHLNTFADMGKEKMTIEKAIELLKDEYEMSKQLEFIKNPLAYALYQVWKKADTEERNKRSEETMKKISTVTYTVEVTEIIKGIDTKFLLTEYPEIIKEKLKNKMEFDNVNVKNIKVFEHE